MKTKLSILFLTIICVLLLVNACKKEPDLTVTTGSITDITPTSAYCRDNSYSREFYSTDIRGVVVSDLYAEPTLEDNLGSFEFASTSSSVWTSSFGGLTPGTKYYVRAFVSVYNRTLYGQVVSFTTSGNITSDIVFNPDKSYGSVTDIEGNTYKTIQIGTQTWMAENLKTTKFRNGSSIPNNKDPQYWITLTTPAYSWYLNNEGTFKKPYGALYNWYTVNTGKLCPAGWHVPGTTEWNTLTTYLGGDSIAFNKLKEAGTAHWIQNSAEATNSSGFTGLPGGYLSTDDSFDKRPSFMGLGYLGYFWASDPLTEGFPSGFARVLHSVPFYKSYQTLTSPQNGCAVRCIKD